MGVAPPSELACGHQAKLIKWCCWLVASLFLSDPASAGGVGGEIEE
jgi:hypothetical protein